MTTHLIDKAMDAGAGQQKRGMKALGEMQAQRLWSLESRTCAALLKSLIDSRFLRRTDRGLFVLRRP